MAKLNEWMGRTQVMGPLQRQAAIDAGAMTKEDFTGPSPTQPAGSVPVGGSSAQSDLAKSLGISVDELKRRQAQQFQQLQRSRPNKASGGQIIGALGRIARRLSADSEPIKRGVPSIIKDKGGNWLPGSVENDLWGMKPSHVTGDQVWAKLPSNITEELKSTIGPHTVARQKYPKEWKAAEDSITPPVSKFVDKQLTKYVKNQMGTKEDPVRALAEQGILHTEMDSPQYTTEWLAKRRKNAGKPPQSVAEAPLAKQWEVAADGSIGSRTASDTYNGPSSRFSEKYKSVMMDPETGEVRPKEFDYLKDDDTVYSSEISNDLGFDHLIDEIHNALNPESGLPANLLIDPRSIDNGSFSMEAAVRRVHDINKWREAQKVEASQALANNAATHLHKDYGDGFRWVELKTRTDPEGWVQGPANTTYWKNSNGEVVYGHPDKQQLSDALKYEGDTMGHCVGGYCDDVASGRSRIYSLRDAKGQPHVTIETEPPKLQNLNRVKLASAVGEDKADEIYSAFISSGANDLDEFVKELGEVGVPRIVQIKGKQNRAPIADYLPYVQDFVKSGQWSDVGDLENAGLRHFAEDKNLLGPEVPVVIPKGYHSPEDLHRIFLDAGVPEQNVSGWLRAEGFAKGGVVNPMEHTHTSTQTKSIDEMRQSSIDSMKRGAKNWVPDLLALPGDLADALAYATRKIAQGQKEQSVPSLGAGAAIRRWALGAKPNTESGFSDPQTPTMEEVTRFINPLMMTSPTKLVKSPLALAALAAATGDATPALPMMAGVIKGRGGNWLNNSVENALKPMLRHADDPQLREALLRAGRDPLETEKVMQNALMVDNWIKGPLTKYLKRDLATPEDPIRKLAEEGILHFEPDWVVEAEASRARARDIGLPAQRLGKSRLALDWEDLADSMISPSTAGDFKYPPSTMNPWVSKLEDSEPVFFPERGDGFEPLKLDHLTDEVYNSLLNGEINPEHLKNGQFSVEAAVRHVAAKNAQRAKDAEKSQIEALQLAAPGKEYENGYRWVELPDTSTPEARELCKSVGKAGGWCTGDDWAAEEYGSGGGKLHVLLDKDGRPHAQVHVGKPDITDGLDSIFESLPHKESLALEGLSQADMLRKIGETSSSSEAREAALRLLSKLENSAPKITQIKPRANSWESQMVKDKLAEDPEYRNTITPLLQDFVKSGQWGEVDDLDNAGMWKHRKTSAYHTKAEAEADEALNDAYSSRNLDDEGNYRPNYADGGLVNFDDLAAFLAPR